MIWYDIEKNNRKHALHTSRTPTTVRQVSCFCEPENRFPMYSIATKYRWTWFLPFIGFDFFASSSSSSLRFWDFDIFDGLWLLLPDSSDSNSACSVCFRFCVIEISIFFSVWGEEGFNVPLLSGFTITSSYFFLLFFFS